MNSLEILPSQYHSELRLDRSSILDNPESWLSKSSIWELYGSSLWRWRYCPKKFDTPTPSMSWGSLIDTLITCPESELHKEFAINPWPNFRTKQSQEWKAEIEAAGKIIISPEQLEEAHKAVRVLTEKHKLSAAIIEKSRKQVMLLNKVTHPVVNKTVQFKSLVDLVPEGDSCLVDLKTCNDISPGGIAKAIARFGYHAQASFYLQGWNAIHNDQRDRFRFIFQESCPPYEVCVVELPATDLADGADIMNHLTRKIVVAADRDHWPMRYPDKAVLLGRAMFGHHQDEEEIDGLTTI